LVTFNLPHILSKLQWRLSCNPFSKENGIQYAELFDVLLHLTSWVLLLVSNILNLKKRNKNNYFTLSYFFTNCLILKFKAANNNVVNGLK
jgi:uncharacterized membrane protein